MVRIALSLMPESLQSQLILLSIDDTMVEKYGEHFENREKLFDHARHNGSNYLNGHCFVSIMLSIPVFDQGKIRYLSFPIGYRMWTKEQTKLAMAADMVKEIMEIIGTERNVCLCCDSWYPKAEITELPQQYENLALICNVRHDTALYDLPPAKTGKKGRPRVRGKQLSFEDFIFSVVDGTDYSVGSRQVITNLFGKKPVHAIVTKTKNGTQRLFICTNYYEQKKFWSFGNYMLRSRIGIERLTNLLTVLYAFMTVLPFYDKTFSALSHNSPQQSRFVIGMTVWHELFLAAFETNHISSKNGFAFDSFCL